MEPNTPGGTAPIFIGPKEVKSVESLPEKHNGTIELVQVTYADGSTDTMTKRLYDVSTTSAATDLTALRDQRMQLVVKSVLDLLLDWGIGLADINFLTQSIAMSINTSMNAANAKLWGKPETALNLIEIDKILQDKVTLKDLIPPPNPPTGQDATPQA